MSSVSYSERVSPTDLTQRTAFEDMTQQRGLLIGVGVAAVALFLMFRSRKDDQREAAKHLVRDWRRVDDVDGARDLLSSNVGPLLRPALLMVLNEVEDQVHHVLRRMEKRVQRL